MKTNHDKPLIFYCADLSTCLQLDFVEGNIFAGFPNPADNYIEQSIDLNRELVKHPANTFFARVCGDSLIDAGVEEGDLLIIDKSIEPSDGDMIVAFIDGDFTLKFVHKDKNSDFIWLKPANDDYPPIKVLPDNNFIVWGVVTYTIKRRK